MMWDISLLKQQKITLKNKRKSCNGEKHNSYQQNSQGSRQIAVKRTTATDRQKDDYCY